MNLKILFLIIVYYSILSLVFVFGGAEVFEDYNATIDLNETGIADSEIDTGGLFGTGISFGRFIGLVGLGIGLPSDTPTFFMILFAVWQTIFTILSIGFVISSIWNG